MTKHISQILPEVLNNIKIINMNNDWINIKEKFPTKPDDYLCYSEEGKISVERVSVYELNRKMVYCDSTDSGYATHWMPLPAPPKKTA